MDAWWHGLPVVTTPIGAEGMTAADAAAGDAAGGAALPPLDPALDGFIWQEGGCGGSSDSSSGGCEASNEQQQQQQQQRQEEWGGLWGAETAEGCAAAAALLYTHEELWGRCQQRGFELNTLLFDRERNLGRVADALEAVAAGPELEERRRHDHAGALLWREQARSTEYFSRWIEMKEAVAAAAATAAAEQGGSSVRSSSSSSSGEGSGGTDTL